MKRKNEKGILFVIMFLAIALVIGSVLLFSTGKLDFYVKKKENNVEITEEKIEATIEEKSRITVGKYVVASGIRTSNGVSEEYIKIYDKNDNFIKELKHIFELKLIKLNSNILYLATNSTETKYYILDNNLNIILDQSKVCEGLENTQCFKLYFNDLNNTITYVTDKLYVIDVKGQVISSIDKTNIVGVYTNYYLVKDGANINVMNYDNQFVVTLTDQYAGVYHAPESCSPIIADLSDDKVNFSVVLYNDYEGKVCDKFTYNSATGEIFTEKYVGHECIG